MTASHWNLCGIAAVLGPVIRGAGRLFLGFSSSAHCRGRSLRLLRVSLAAKHALPAFLLSAAAVLAFLSCVSQSPASVSAGSATQSTGLEIDTGKPAEPQGAIDVQAQILKDVRNLLETGSPSSLTRALEQLENSEAGKSEMGREYAYIAAMILKNVFPRMYTLSSDPPPSPSSLYPALFARSLGGEKNPDLSGPALAGEENILKIIIGSLIVQARNTSDILNYAEPVLDRGLRLKGGSVILLYLKGLVLEKKSDLTGAYGMYSKALELDNTCYPADTGLARIEIIDREFQKAYNRIASLAAETNAESGLLGMAAYALYGMSRYEEALTMTTRAMAASQDTDLVFLKAKILMALGSYGQAEKLLQMVEKLKSGDADVIMTRLALEEKTKGFKAALAYAEEKWAEFNDNGVFNEAYARLLMEDNQREKARPLLYAILTSDPGRVSVLMMLLEDAVTLLNWEQAELFADQIIAVRKEKGTGAGTLNEVRFLELAVRAAVKNGSADKAHTLAEELYNLNPQNAAAALPLVESLVALKRFVEAGQLIDELLARSQPGPPKSRLLYLKSMTVEGNDAAISVLQQSLFEDLTNVDALLAISEAYLAAGDQRTALRYLKQAASMNPKNAEISARLLNLQAKIAQ
ncbi:MAG: tetratricopeptide repeat protein [Spirochaetales bacterium]|nr:MAG: tetratricopeptide repeat protein [Spirochaetales bacterium]